MYALGGSRIWASGALLLGLLFTVAGCGGASSMVGSVTGTVTLDGQPLEGALVTFSPTKGGSPSTGKTDGGGKYALQYTRDVAGAEIGEHSVSISTYSGGDEDAEPPIAETPEKVPAKYNAQTELRKTVESGSNTIDFQLESAGGDSLDNAT